MMDKYISDLKQRLNRNINESKVGVYYRILIGACVSRCNGRISNISRDLGGLLSICVDYICCILLIFKETKCQNEVGICPWTPINNIPLWNTVIISTRRNFWNAFGVWSNNLCGILLPLQRPWLQGVVNNIHLFRRLPWSPT